MLLFLLVSLGSVRGVRDTLGTPSLDLSGELFPDPGESDSSLTYDDNLEENPGDWTSVCREVGKGLMVLFPDNAENAETVRNLPSQQ